ncbi:hypothetical protein [Bradyrhizobium sp. ERR14]|uniref:hypothetical protein n=1 Tax=Bradyrhizobium sp. ERR14 TaxID=2663837 RepID=UPI00161421E6|nr:hypothetical protein [Bradyrhizobium sp. ERR14]MBB4397946.1 hypothetical protein [Bradyrhizobium sp. ERR14]
MISLRDAAPLRLLILLLGAFVMIPASPVQAEQILPPVRIEQEAFACVDISVVKHHAQLVQNGQTEQLDKLHMVYRFAEGCAFPRPGQYMFYEGYDATSKGAFVCLRQRPGSDCLWMKRTAIGEVPTYFPGRRLEETNKGIPCTVWDQVVKKSRDTDKAIYARFKGNRPSGDGNAASEMAQGMVTGMLGMVNGGPDSHKARSLNLCEYYLLSAQQEARRLSAYEWCPQLVAPDKLAAERSGYRSDIAEIANSCLGNK